MKDYVEASVGVAAHRESHDCYERFDGGPRRVLEFLNPI